MRDICLIDSVITRDSFLRLARLDTFSDLADLLAREARLFRHLAARCPAFLVSICDILFVCSGKKVVAVAARSIVAFMQNIQRERIHSVVQLVREAMDLKYSLAYLYPAVSTVQGTLPWPALIFAANVHVGPKAVDLFLSQFRERFTIGSRHLISFTDHCSRLRTFPVFGASFILYLTC